MKHFQQDQTRTGRAEWRQIDGAGSLAEAADRFALQATESVLAPDENVDTLDRLAKAIRPLTGR